MRRFLTVFSICSLMLLTACSAKHDSHTVSESYERDAKDHWQLCECGEEVNRAAHKLVDVTCTVCGSEVWTDDDGSANVYNYDTNGDLLRTTSYDAGGNVTCDQTRVYAYDEEGDLTGLTTFENGQLSGETEFAPGSDGLWYEARYTGYHGDGSRFTNEYNETGDRLVFLSYDANGVLQEESRYEYAQTADGETYNSKVSSVFADGSTSVCEYNEQFDILREAICDADGTAISDLRYEYEYDEKGRKKTEKRYQGDILIEEFFYKTIEDEDGWTNYAEKIIAYIEDGSRHIITTAEDGTETLTIIDADGTVHK